MRLPTRDSAAGKGIATALQALCGFIFGLVLVVWNVPGVPQAVFGYVQNNVIALIMFFGVPMAIASGVVGFVMNLIREEVKNY